LRQTSAIVYCAIDTLIPLRGSRAPIGLGARTPHRVLSAGDFQDFCIALDHANVPSIWLTSRTRAQLDDPLRKLGHTHPFIAEGGSAVYIPEDYFHLRGERSERRGRFLCIPVAQSQPAAAEALESLSAETGVAVVTLRSLSPRELAQNSGLPQREAELARQRDFDELFFFAGASDSDIGRFLQEARRRKLQLRPRGVLWSLAVGASVPRCVRELTKLFDRALHTHATSIGIASQEEADELFPACDRNILLIAQSREEPLAPLPGSPRTKRIHLQATDAWEQVLAQITAKN
jgi:predicted mannosyl-3-phosphoglycerate phosphatase (HAD superfamily)